MTTVMPCYLAIDTSASTSDVINELGKMVDDLLALFARSPQAADLLPLTLISFSTEPRIVFSPTKVRDTPSRPLLEANGSTSYAPVFRLVQSLIDQDVSRYKAEGHSVYRPALFFLTDGNPTDVGWEDALAALQSPSYRAHPNIVAIGYGAVDPALIAIIGTRGSFFVSELTGAALASSVLEGIESMFETLTESIVSAGPQFAAPAELPQGWIDVAELEF